MKHVFYIDSLSDSYSLNPQSLDAERYEFKISTDAEDIFRVMNIVTGDPEIELPLKLRCRSMSVGDVYVEDGKAFFCAPAGWETIEGPFVRALLTKLPPEPRTLWERLGEDPS